VLNKPRRLGGEKNKHPRMGGQPARPQWERQSAKTQETEGGAKPGRHPGVEGALQRGAARVHQPRGKNSRRRPETAREKNQTCAVGTVGAGNKKSVRGGGEAEAAREAECGQKPENQR